MPASAPESVIARHQTPRTSTPPYSAAAGCSPVARSSKPRRVRNRNHQVTRRGERAMNSTTLAAEP